MTTIHLTPVRELHGRSVKARLAKCLVPVHRAKPGDLVAVREQGFIEDGGPFVNARTFLRKTMDGYEDCRLSDLPCGLRPAAAAAMGFLDDDWELTGDLADAAPMAFDEGHPNRRFETFKFREGIGFLRLPKSRGTGASLEVEEGQTILSILFMEPGEDGRAEASSIEETVATIRAFSGFVPCRLMSGAGLASSA